jgi:hypothetical protein
MEVFNPDHVLEVCRDGATGEIGLHDPEESGALCAYAG